MFADLKVKSIAARKAQDKPTLLLLSTLIGDLQAGAKIVDGEKIVTDDAVLQMVRKYIKGTVEVLAHDASNEQALFEQKLLTEFLPQQMTDDQLQSVIAEYVVGGASNMGQVMGKLKADHGGLYDGRAASTIAKAAFA